MAWIEITRPKYQRDGLRYASDTTDRGMIVDRAAPPATGVVRAYARDQHA